jgi:hypothetical protein
MATLTALRWRGRAPEHSSDQGRFCHGKGWTVSSRTGALRDLLTPLDFESEDSRRAAMSACRFLKTSLEVVADASFLRKIASTSGA